jgi:cytochrome c oxidase subunit 4
MAHHGTWKRLGDGSLAGQDFEEGLGHILPLSVLRNVLLILLFLTVITVWISRIDFGTWNIVIAIVIASIKAGIVGTYFMHLKFESNTILMYVAYPVVILFILIGGCVMDTVTKDDIHVLPFGMASDPKPVVIPAGHGGEHGAEGGHH